MWEVYIMVQSLHFMDLETAISNTIAELREHNNRVPPLDEEELVAVARYALAFYERSDYEAMLGEIQREFNGSSRVYFTAEQVLSDAKSLLAESKKHPPARYPDTLGWIGGTDPLDFEDPYRPRRRGHRRSSI